MLRATALVALALLVAPASAAPRTGDGPYVTVTGREPVDGGARVSVEAVRADVKVVLRALADVGGLSVVFADGCDARVTVSLRDVPLGDAMEAVAWAAGLGIAPSGRVRAVAPGLAP